MTKTAPEAQDKREEQLWSVGFTLHYAPESLAPYWINCDVGYRPGGPAPQKWTIDGLASFDAPTLIPPRVGADLIPYLIYHLDEIKVWLTEEHVRRVFNGTEEKIRPEACVVDPLLPIDPL